MASHHRFPACAALALLLVLALGACGPDVSAPSSARRTARTGGIVLQVRLASGVPQPTTARPMLAPPLTLPPNVVTVHVVVSGFDMSDVTQDFSISSNPTGGSISGIPAGSNRSVDMQGLDSSEPPSIGV